jgi:three-Cys-motif partner protein
MGPASVAIRSAPGGRLTITKEKPELDESQLHLFDAADYNPEQFVRDATALHIPRPKRLLDETREFGGWVIDKLDLLALYLKQYRRVAGGGTYIDGFAGTGRIRVNGVDRKGSAAIAIDSGSFREMLFFERPHKAKRLQTFIRDEIPERRTRQCSVYGGDFNQLIVPLLDDQAIPRDKPCFAFLDPNSTQLAWETVGRLAEYKGSRPDQGLKMELWILLNTHQALSRLMPREPPRDYEESGNARALDRVMGGREAWWDIFEQRRGPRTLAERYAARLTGELNYGAARTHLILDRKTKRPQYYMIHAGDHKAAFSFMRWAEVQTAQERWETPTLFPDSRLER